MDLLGLKLNLFSLCGAVLLFFLPWTDIQCSSNHVATQSGVETIYGGITFDDGIAPQVKDPVNKNREPLYAPILGIAFVFVAAGAAVCFVGLLIGRSLTLPAGVCAVLALALIVVQVALGFPVNRAIRKAAQESAETQNSTSLAFGAAMVPRATRTPWFYIELVCLAIPAAVLVNGQITRFAKPTAEKPIKAEP